MLSIVRVGYTDSFLGIHSRQKICKPSWSGGADNHDLLANWHSSVIRFAGFRLKSSLVHEQAPRVIRADLVGSFWDAGNPTYCHWQTQALELPVLSVALPMGCVACAARPAPHKVSWRSQPVPRPCLPSVIGTRPRADPLS